MCNMALWLTIRLYSKQTIAVIIHGILSGVLIGWEAITSLQITAYE